MLGRLLRTRRQWRPALVERLVSFVSVGGFADPAVQAALRRRRRWAGTTETQRWLRQDVVPLALLEAIAAASVPSWIAIPWRTWDLLRPRARFPPWRYATAVTMIRGKGVRLFVRPRWLPQPFIAWWLRGYTLRRAGQRVLAEAAEVPLDAAATIHTSDDVADQVDAPHRSATAVDFEALADRAGLTATERELLNARLAGRASVDALARRRRWSPSTLRVHTRNLLRKLDRQR
jgi:DNA-binding CsgD family transcriptional regulator